MDYNFQVLFSIFVSGEIQENFRLGNRHNQIYAQVAGDLAELNLGHTVKQQSERPQQL